jgi:hypothetical protein
MHSVRPIYLTLHHEGMPVQIGEQSDQAATIPWAHLRIPAFPQIAIQVLQLTNNEDVSMRQLGDLISFDPSFSGEVLTIANSALYAPRVPVTSILQAIAAPRRSTPHLPRAIRLAAPACSYIASSS